MKLLHLDSSLYLDTLVHNLNNISGTLPMAASLVSPLCTFEHSSRQARSSALLGLGLVEENISEAFLVAYVAERTVSVRPCLNAAVLQDSYVAAVSPYCL